MACGKPSKVTFVKTRAGLWCVHAFERGIKKAIVFSICIKIESTKMDIIPQGSKMEVVQWTRQQLFDAVHEEWDENLDDLIENLGVKLLNKAPHLFRIEKNVTTKQ
ncbi:uncharacterized protein LOC124295364 [Neodiprion lecontei]|uniref:Uncharacterized protein LOC124295364 n=1 Tax=Neodiprion lecontei TaxID=441921 RepID=A0ABM3GL85_NEOLC|nr:uncharacterized protein LOC124295364 [Neodiprion lecontei]